MNNNIKSFLIKHLIVALYDLAGLLMISSLIPIIFMLFNIYESDDYIYISNIVCLLLGIIILCVAIILHNKYLCFKTDIINIKEYIDNIIIFAYGGPGVFVYISYSIYFNIISFDSIVLKYIIFSLSTILGTISFIVGEYIINKYVCIKKN